MDKITNSYIYSELFARYVSHTNGKKRVSRSLAKLYASKRKGKVLDVGAGTGEIANSLASVFRQVIAIDPKKELFPKTGKTRRHNVVFHETRLEEFQSSYKYDLILMSYLLDTYSSDQLLRILNKAESLKSRHGKIVSVTYLDGCDWDIFSHVVAQILGIERTGGFTRLMADLPTLGWYPRVRKVVETEIFGSSINQLYGNLAFFYRDRLDAYLKSKNVFVPLLRQFSKTAARTTISVQEVIIEINRLDIFAETLRN